MTDKRHVTAPPSLPVVDMSQALGRAPEHFEGTDFDEFLTWARLYYRHQLTEWDFFERRKRYSKALGC